MQQGLYGAVPLAHFLLRERLGPGDRVVDATCGNGGDALLAAELVGPVGRVWAFDVQESALARTRERLEAAGLDERAALVPAGHERLAEFVAEPVKAVIFNLGYLPAGGQEIKTSAVTTVSALKSAEGLLQAGGLIIVAVYTGHEGGEEEWQAVQEWGAALNPHEFNVWQARQLNRSGRAPFLVFAEKVVP